jgi:hypothetical protein
MSKMGGDLESLRYDTTNRLEELEQMMSVGRVADVELLAINACCLAGDALAKLGAEAPSRVPEAIHGHALLMYLLQLDYSTGRLNPNTHGYHVLEIGGTREVRWPQASTSRLAATCRYLKIRMLTVDIDPLSAFPTAKLKQLYGQAIASETRAGELFLADWTGELPPYIYIDAYDFDHGEHSEKRQDRYRSLQGAEISDKNCSKMHYDCAIQFADKCPEKGIVVFDDVFHVDGKWEGKGATAVPYMLENGFELLMRTKKTCILRKKKL